MSLYRMGPISVDLIQEVQGPRNHVFRPLYNEDVVCIASDTFRCLKAASGQLELFISFFPRLLSGDGARNFQRSADHESFPSRPIRQDRILRFENDLSRS